MLKYKKSLTSIYNKLLSMKDNIENKLDTLEEKFEKTASDNVLEKINRLYEFHIQIESAMENIYNLID